MANLKMSSDYYANARLTVGDFFTDVKERGWDKAWKDSKDWGDNDELVGAIGLRLMF